MLRNPKPQINKHEHNQSVTLSSHSRNYVALGWKRQPSLRLPNLEDICHIISRKKRNNKNPIEKLTHTETLQFLKFIFLDHTCSGEITVPSTFYRLSVQLIWAWVILNFNGRRLFVLRQTNEPTLSLSSKYCPKAYL